MGNACDCCVGGVVNCDGAAPSAKYAASASASSTDPNRPSSADAASAPRSVAGPRTAEIGRSIHSSLVFDVAACVEDDQFISCGDDGLVVRYQWGGAARDTVLDSWEGHARTVNCLAFAETLHGVFSGSRDKTVKQWTFGRPEAVQTFTGHELSVSAVCVSSAGADSNRVVASGARDCSVRFWDVGSGKQLSCRNEARNIVTAMRWIGQEDSVLQCSEDLSIRVWDTRSSTVAQRCCDQDHFALACNVSRDGLKFITAYNGFDGDGCQVKLWDRRKLAPVAVLGSHQQAARACCFVDADCRYVVSGSKDGSICVWDALSAGDQSDCYVAEYRMPNSRAVSSLCMSPSGSALFAGCEAGFVGVWKRDAEDAPTFSLVAVTAEPNA